MMRILLLSSLALAVSALDMESFSDRPENEGEQVIDVEVEDTSDIKVENVGGPALDKEEVKEDTPALKEETKPVHHNSDFEMNIKEKEQVSVKEKEQVKEVVDVREKHEEKKEVSIQKETKVTQKKEKKEKEAKQYKLGSGPKEVCEVPVGFHRKIGEHSTRNWTDLSGPVTFAEPVLTKIFYINLDKSETRKAETLENLAAQFPGVAVERWRATGKGEAGRMNWSDYSSKGKAQGAGIGTIATWFSHYLLTQHISEQKDPNAVYLIFEDDLMMKRPNLMQSTMCQIQQLPADWDLFKFGYWGYRMTVAQSKVGYPACDGLVLNEYTCQQKGFAWNYMGNQAYAMRPGGAKAILERLKNTPIMDVDGAMMPGMVTIKGVKGGRHTSYSHPNTYVSKHTLVQHSWRHTSTRTNGGEQGAGKRNFKQMVADVSELPLTPDDEDKVDALEKEASNLEQDVDGRETSSQQYRRLMTWKEQVLDKYELDKNIEKSVETEI